MDEAFSDILESHGSTEVESGHVKVYGRHVHLPIACERAKAVRCSFTHLFQNPPLGELVVMRIELIDWWVVGLFVLLLILDYALNLQHSLYFSSADYWAICNKYNMIFIQVLLITWQSATNTVQSSSTIFL